MAVGWIQSSHTKSAEVPFEFFCLKSFKGETKDEETLNWLTPLSDKLIFTDTLI